MTNIKDIIVELCILHVTKDSGVRGKASKQAPRHFQSAEKSIDAQLNCIETPNIGDKSQYTILIGQANIRPSKTIRPKEANLADYLGGIMYLGYKALKNKISKSYCSLREIIRQVFHIKYRPDQGFNPIKEAKRKIQEWSLLLPRGEVNSMRELYLKLLT